MPLNVLTMNNTRQNKQQFVKYFWRADHRGVLWSFIVIWAIIVESNKSESCESFFICGIIIKPGMNNPAPAVLWVLTLHGRENKLSTRCSPAQAVESVLHRKSDTFLLQWGMALSQRSLVLCPVMKDEPLTLEHWGRSPCCDLSISCIWCQDFTETNQRWPPSAGSVGPFISIK